MRMTSTTARTARIATDRPYLPFSRTLPGIILGQTNTGSYFAFNLDNPGGVKLLDGRVYERLSLSLDADRAVPNLSCLNDSADRALYEHCLIKLNGAYNHAFAREGSKDSLSVWLNVIDACNLGCFYCYIPELKKRVSLDHIQLSKFGIDSNAATQIADHLESYCLFRGISHLHIKFAGGEPTLVIKEIDHFCNHLSKRISNLRVTFGILTNGVFDLDEVLPVIQRHKMKVSISIDGMQPTHDRVRFARLSEKRVGTWDTIFKNVGVMREASIKPYFLFTITRRNFKEIEDFAAFVHESGCGFRLSLERGRKTVDFALQHDTAVYLSSFYKRAAERAPLGIRFDRDAKFSEWNLNRKKTVACSTCRGSVAIGRDGAVASCQMRLNEPVGKLHTNSLQSCMEKFGEDSRTQKLYRPKGKTGGCTRCEFRFVCAGGCPQHTRDVFGDLDRPSPWCFVYGSLLPTYIEANAMHLSRRVTEFLKTSRLDAQMPADQ